MLLFCYKNDIMLSLSDKIRQMLLKVQFYFNLDSGEQWFSGRVLDLRPGAVGSSLTGVTALCSLSKTHLS